MRRRFSGLLILLLTIFIFTAAVVLPTSAQDTPNIVPTKIIDEQLKTQMGQLQIPFIKNEGQLPNDVKYYAQTFAGLVMVGDDGIVYLLQNGNQNSQVMREKFVLGQPELISGQNVAVTRINYFKGADAGNWQQDLPTFNIVTLGEVYENIIVNLKAYGDNVEKIFVVGPGGDPGQIVMQLDGVEAINIGDDGQLVIQTLNGSVSMTAPVAYQEIDGERVPVEVAYRVEGKQYSFEIGDYDPSYELIIDPMLASSLFGGRDDNLTAMAVDNAGNVYVAGYTSSPDTVENAKRAYTEGNTFEWDLWSDPDPSYVDNPQDVFVAKLDPNLTSLLAATFIGGSADDRAKTMTIGSDGSIYIGGLTYSSGIRDYEEYIEYDENEYYDPFDDRWDDYWDGVLFELEPPTAFPTTTGAYQTRFLGTDENTTCIDSKTNSFFVSRLDAGLNLVASTFLGEGKSGIDGINGIAVDTSGNVYVAGKTESDQYPTTAGAYDESFNDQRGNAFVSKLDGNLTNLQASTFLGGGGGKYEGTSLYLDGTGANDITIDAGNIYITGTTTDKNFPIVGGYQAQLNQNKDDTSKDAFVAKFNSDLSALLASTYLGGSNYEEGLALAADTNNLFVAGVTTSADFPVCSGAYQETMTEDSSYNEIFITKLNKDLSQLAAGTYLGGNNREDVYGIALDTNNVYVTGSTGSYNYPITDGSNGDIIVSKLDKNLTDLRASTTLGKSGAGKSIIVKNGKVYIAGETSSSDYPVTDGAYKVSGSNFITILTDNLTDARITEVTTDFSFSNKSFGLGTEIPIQVKFNANVNVEGEGIPELKLNASEDAAAIYNTGSGTNILEFLYTVQPGDKVDVLNYVSTDSLVLDNCSILDMGEDPAKLTLPDLNSYNALSYRKIKINTVAPTVVKVTSPQADGTYGAGAEIAIEVTFAEKVKVEGVPQLILNTEPERVANYASGSETNTLTFIYAVQKEDSSTRLNYKDTNSLLLNEGSIQDLMDNVANLTLPDVDSEVSLAGQKNLVIDNNAPNIIKVTSSLADGSYGAGQAVPINITFSEAVNVTETPRLALNTTPERYANYVSGSGTTVLTFEYIVQNGDNSLAGTVPTQLNYKSKDDLFLRFGTEVGTITGVAKGNNAILTLPDPDSPDALAGSSNIFIDTNPPQYKSLSTDESTYTTYGAETPLHINLTFNEVVYVTGTPYCSATTSISP